MKVLINQLARIREINAELDKLSAQLEAYRTDENRLVDRRDSSEEGLRRLGAIRLAVQSLPEIIARLHTEKTSLEACMEAVLVDQRRKFIKFVQERVGLFEDRIYRTLREFTGGDRAAKEITKELSKSGRLSVIKAIRKHLDWLGACNPPGTDEPAFVRAQRFVDGVERISKEFGWS